MPVAGEGVQLGKRPLKRPAGNVEGRSNQP